MSRLILSTSPWTGLFSRPEHADVLACMSWHTEGNISEFNQCYSTNCHHNSAPTSSRAKSALISNNEYMFNTQPIVRKTTPFQDPQ